MRSYDCHLYKKQTGTLIKNNNTACFAGLRGHQKGTIIYISHFKQKDTEQYIELLINVINKITPCQIVIINTIEYIEIKLLNTYSQSLIILNFIRNLWNKINTDYYKKSENYYNLEFFKILEKSKKYKEPLKRLTYANIESCKLFNLLAKGHSNTYNYKSLKIKTTEELLAYKGNFSENFLIT